MAISQSITWLISTLLARGGDQIAAARALSWLITDRPEKGVGVDQEPNQTCSNNSAISGLAASIDSGIVN
jgi:hypothetical protein